MGTIFEDVPLTDEPIQIGETDFEFFQRSSLHAAQVARRCLELWISEIPRDEVERFRHRLRFGNDADFNACTFELLVHAYLLRSRCDVLEYEPEFGKHQPDFLIRTADATDVVVEASVLERISQSELSHQAHCFSVQTALNWFPRTQKHLHLDFEGDFVRSPSLKRITNEFQAWLNREVNSCNFEIEEAGVTISVMELCDALDDFVGPTISIVTGMDKSGLLAPETDIRKKLKRKSKQLSKTPYPCLLALKLSLFHRDQMSLNQALFGSERLHICNETMAVIGKSREDNGCFLHRGKPDMTRISGLLSFSNAEPAQLGEMTVEFWQHPWAAYSYDAEELLCDRWLPNSETSKLDHQRRATNFKVLMTKEYT